MCDPALIAAILEELGYLDEKKDKDRKGKVQGKQPEQDNSKDSGEQDQRQK